MLTNKFLPIIVESFFNFDSKKKKKSGVAIRVYTPLGKKEQGQFALDVAVKTLPFYEGLFLKKKLIFSRFNFVILFLRLYFFIFRGFILLFLFLA